jgi:hypothetical protein
VGTISVLAKGVAKQEISSVVASAEVETENKTDPSFDEEDFDSVN